MAAHELSGDYAFAHVREVLMIVIEALKEGKNINDNLDFNEAQFDKEVVKEDDSFFEPLTISADGNNLTIKIGLEYVIRSSMVRTAIKVAAALAELQRDS